MNDLCLDLHDLGFCFGLDSAFRGFAIGEIVRVDDVTKTADEVEVFVLLFDAAGDDDVNGVDKLSLLDDLFALLVGLFDGFHPDLDNLIASQVGKQRTVG